MSDLQSSVDISKVRPIGTFSSKIVNRCKVHRLFILIKKQAKDKKMERIRFRNRESSLNQASFMKGKLKMEKGKDMVFSNGQMEQSMLGTGRTAKPMGRESSLTQMETTTMANGRRTKPMEREFTSELKEEGMKVNGSMMSLMDLEFSSGEMEIFIGVISSLGSSREEASTFGVTILSMMAIGSKARFKGKASIDILMEESIKENGKTT